MVDPPQPPVEAFLRLESVGVTYRSPAGDHPALSDVSLALGRGRSCVVIGPTGCGKTSLLYLLAGLMEPTRGEVWINDKSLAGIRRQTSLILQHHGLFPWKNAFSNVSLGLAIRGAPRDQKDRICRDLMEKLGIWDVHRSFPGQLSGGQRQRVAIARSLVTGPDLLLMDEPFSALDAMTRESLQDLLLNLWRERAFTFLLVTHSIEEAVFLGGRIVILSRRPGRILKILDNPRAGARDFRLSETFYEMCSQVRHFMEHL